MTRADEQMRGMTSRYRRWVAAVVVVAVLAVAGMWRLSILREAARDHWNEQLSSNADVARQMIRHWLGERESDLRTAGTAVAVVAGEMRRSPDPQVRRAAGERVVRALDVLALENGHREVWLMDGSGREVARSTGAPAALEPHLALARRAMVDGDAAGGPWIAGDGTLRIGFSARVSAGDDVAEGALVLAADPSDMIVPLLSAQPALAATDSFRVIARADNSYVSLVPTASGRRLDPPVVAAWEDAPAAVRIATLGADSFGLFEDQAGVPILAAAFPIDRRPWGIVGQITAGDAYRDTSKRLAREGLVLAGLLGVVTLGALAGRRSGQLRNLRQQLEAEQALEVSEARYRTIVEHASDGIFIADPDGNHVDVNARGCEVLGYTHDELLAMNMRDLMDPEDLRTRPLRLDELRAGRDLVTERRLRRKDGSVLEVEIGVRMLPDGRLIGIVRDITERKRAEAAIRQSEALYRELFEHAAYGIYRSTPEGKFLAVNATLVEQLGYGSVDELLEQDVTSLYRDPSERPRLIEQYKDRGVVLGVEVDWKRKDGSTVTLRLSGRPVHREDGSLEYFEMFAEDVTERRDLEAQLRQAQKMEAVGQLTGGIAHDFNNLLTTILANSELLAEAVPETDADSRAGVQEIRHAAEQGATMIKKLMAFSRREQLEFGPVDLSEVCREARGMLSRLVPETISVTLSGETVPAARADRGAIEQMLMNLATNARDAMPAGGELALSTRLEVLDEAFVERRGFGEPGEFVCLEVSDTGTGMDELTKAKLFEPFFTTKPAGRGTGLGMAMVYGLVKQHDGFIDVVSAPGEGTAVRIYLPVWRGDTADWAVQDVRAPRGGSETILVVEDQEQVRRAVQKILVRFGYRVLTAPDGEVALEILRAGAPRVDLVVTDIVMPRMPGGRLYDAAKETATRPKFLFTTGYAAADLPDAAPMDPAVPLLRKPWQVRDLLAKVREVLDRG